MKLLLFAACGMLLSCCASFRKIDNANVDQVDQSRHTRFNGKYENYAIESRTNLWGIIGSLKDQKRRTDWDSLSVILTFNKKNKLEATLTGTDTLLSKKIVRGKIKNGYFCGRPYFMLYPFVPLIFGYDTSRYRISMIDNRLVVDTRRNYWVCSLGFGESGNEHTSITFRKQ
jgi:hypothetical protein